MPINRIKFCKVCQLIKTCKEIKNCSDVFCKPPTTPTKPILKINPAVKKINIINAVSNK